ncbi:MAG TPA: TerB family tellurite resistance protein, partial [Candidatus Caenarcaniphilales bacterium]
VGAAWLDGKIQPEERKHLYQVAQNQGVADDPDLQPLLHELTPVSLVECESWVKEYLGKCPTPEDSYQLIEAISALLYSDGDIAQEEAKLLTQLQLSDSQTEPAQFHNSAIKSVQKLYHRWVKS